MAGEKEILKELFPNKSLAPSTYKKNSDTIFTKIKDRLGLEYSFNKVVSWVCPEEGCRDEFIAIARANSVATTIENISKSQINRYHTHWIRSHDGNPPIPTNIKILSKLGESRVAALDNRLQVEMSVNPRLILATGNPTYKVNNEILQTIKTVNR